MNKLSNKIFERIEEGGKKNHVTYNTHATGIITSAVLRSRTGEVVEYANRCIEYITYRL